jgi:very-short-patch-repair endonuclease
VNSIGFCKEHHGAALVQAKKTPQLGSKALKISRDKGNKTPLKPIFVPPSKKQKKIAFAEKLRRDPTPAEAKILELLKASSLKSSFEFQPILNGYIPDFLFPRSKLIVEADGWHHTTTAGMRADARRTHHLMKDGYRVVRFMNREILENAETVLNRIMALHCARLDNDAEGFVPIPRKRAKGSSRTRIL